MIGERKKIISLDIHLSRYADALDKIADLARKRSPAYACFANVHMLMEAHTNSGFAQYVNASTYTFPDGVPLVYALKKLYGIRQDRIAGIDFMIDFLKECETHKLSVFFFGSTEKALTALKARLLEKHPSLLISGSISPPYREFSEQEDAAFIDIINKSGANAVFVSLGCPKQETWMAKNSHKINAVLLGVGAAFEIHAGLKKRAPLWMQKTGLEWLYRFMLEPSRLGKRYLVTNTQFVFLFLRAFLFGNHRNKK